MKVTQGFTNYYPKDVVLEMKRTIYGTKQAAKQYWKGIQKGFHDMGYRRSKTDPCLQCKWIDNKLIIWMSWVDDLFVT